MAIIGIGIKVYKMGAYLTEITELEELHNTLGTCVPDGSFTDSSITDSPVSVSHPLAPAPDSFPSVMAPAEAPDSFPSVMAPAAAPGSFPPADICYANNLPACSGAAGQGMNSAGDAAGTARSGITAGSTLAAGTAITAGAGAVSGSNTVPDPGLRPDAPAPHTVRPGKRKKQPASCLFLTNSRNVQKVLELANISFEGEINLRKVGFSKVEPQQECIWGSLYIPNMVDVMGTKHRIIFFINRQHIVIVDDYDFSARVINRIRSKRTHQADTKGKLLYNFLTDIINGDLMTLAVYEKNLIAMEERVVQERMQNYQNTLVPMRNELLILQEYYDELRDLGKELEEDANRFFDKNQRKYFGVFSDRADRLMNKSGQLLEYAKQIKDDYETTITARQNTTMQFLTIISTIFMPLTLITSWYGMNFENMPELENGYPFVIALSLIVIAITLIIFRYKKLL